MKVKAKKLKENNGCFIKDKEYEVMAIEGPYYRIVDESGEDYMYPAGAFIVTETEPEPPEEKWEGF